jgi:hypothetical protein
VNRQPTLWSWLFEETPEAGSNDRTGAAGAGVSPSAGIVRVATQTITARAIRCPFMLPFSFREGTLA